MKTPSGEISTAPSQGLLVKIRDTPDIIRSKNSVVLVATLSEEHYQQLFGYCTDMLLNAAAGKLPVLLDLLDPKYRIFLSILGTLYRSLDEEQNAHLRQDVVIRCLEKALWNQFDDLVPNFEVETPVDQDYTLLPKHLRKAVDFIHEHADQELNMSCLEKVSGVSSRSLQAGFKDWLGIRPMHYVKKIRLSKVRADLLNATPQSAVIGDIAARWGFFHLSNFSKDFRNEFGELPSETLHRSRLERAM
ncbi:AraC family transcriptional regulator [Pseudomaricurvus alkylphenolicus]|uniref:AraC family transcriptional regulator n=1 Tax=Pseudomaricurvus alkylphenolicus TaxID=1306991 RepID=UPI00141E2F3E|nr:helix-turn-helix domain-containing protein [Pseudomaricurvus alkylphenolicus]NIB38531.1 AraC family transcriptional regulator [Pseudomaricurvus alkylphenolicus]